MPPRVFGFDQEVRRKGNSDLRLDGAVDGRFIHDENEWTFDLRSMGEDNTEFRGPWLHAHRQQGEVITLELCAPSVMTDTQPVEISIVPRWDAYGVELNSQSIEVYPYQEPEWQINPDSSKLEDGSVMSISGSLFNNTQSGDVTFEFALNASLLMPLRWQNKAWLALEPTKQLRSLSQEPLKRILISAPSSMKVCEDSPPYRQGHRFEILDRN